MSDHDDDDTYVYKGEDGERAPQTDRVVDYVANITSIKENAMYRCDRITSVIHLDSIITIEDAAYDGCDLITYIHLSLSLETIG